MIPIRGTPYDPISYRSATTDQFFLWHIMIWVVREIKEGERERGGGWFDLVSDF